MASRPAPDAIAPGQESVWDSPRPPALVPSDELVTVVLGGVEICETSTSWRVLETSHPPTYYLPRHAFLEAHLAPPPAPPPSRRTGPRPWPLLLRVEGRGVLPRRGGRHAGRRTGRLVLPPAQPA